MLNIIFFFSKKKRGKNCLLKNGIFSWKIKITDEILKLQANRNKI